MRLKGHYLKLIRGIRGLISIKNPGNPEPPSLTLLTTDLLFAAFSYDFIAIELLDQNKHCSLSPSTIGLPLPI